MTTVGIVAGLGPESTFDELAELSVVPLLSIVEVSVEEALRRGMRRLHPRNWRDNANDER